MNSPLLALDIGLKRTGVAISESGLIAQPLTVIEIKPPHFHKLVSGVVDLVQEFSIQTLVIGVPFTMDEGPTGQALKVEQIISHIEQAFTSSKSELKIVRVNEYHSTLDAAKLYPTTDPDSAAATIILQDYIDSNLNV